MTDTLESEIIPLFSNPLMITNFTMPPIDLTNIEWVPNTKNQTSSNKHILDTLQFKNLRTIVNNCIKSYFYEVLMVKKQTEIHLTESWLNLNMPGDSHPTHSHPNSILSGIIYLQGDYTTGNTVFYKEKIEGLHFEYSDANLWNGKMWDIVPEIGKLVVFPSTLSHSASINQSTTPRVTLSFNTFVRGIVSAKPLSSLSI